MKYLIYIACLIASVALGGTGFDLSSGSISAPIDATNTIAFFGETGNGWKHYANVSGTKYLDGVATSWTDEFYTVTGGTNIEFNANSIADPRIYNRALSADEIRELASMSMTATNLGTRPLDPLYGNTGTNSGSLLLSTKVQAPMGEQLTNSDITDYMGNSISVSGTVTATASPIKGRVDGSGNWVQEAFGWAEAPIDYQHYWHPSKYLDSDDHAGDLDGTMYGGLTESSDGWDMGAADTKYVGLDGPISNGTSYTIGCWIKPDIDAMNSHGSGGWIISDREQETDIDFHVYYRTISSPYSYRAGSSGAGGGNPTARSYDIKTN